MQQRTDIKGVLPESSCRFPKGIGVAPHVVDVLRPHKAFEMVPDVCLHRNKIRLELHLHTNALGFEVQLSVLFQAERQFVVEQLRSGYGIELDIRRSEELAVELQPVVRAVVVVKERFLTDKPLWFSQA